MMNNKMIPFRESGFQLMVKCLIAGIFIFSRLSTSAQTVSSGFLTMNDNYPLHGISSSVNNATNLIITDSDRLQNIKAVIKEINSQITKIAPESHELHDYFIESAEIIVRLSGYIEKDISQGNKVDAGIGLMEAEFLSSFLKEELSVTSARDKAAYEVIDVTKFGLKGDGVTDNGILLADLLLRIQNKSYVKLLFPEGEYFFKEKPDKKAILLQNRQNITFEGLGKVTFIFEGYKSGANMSVQDCMNLEFRNISIDLKIPTCTMGTIIAVEDGNKIRIKINEGYPEPDKSYWTASILRGLVKNPETGINDPGCGDPRVIKLEITGDKEYRLTLDDNALSGNLNMTGNFTTGYYFSLHPRGRPGAENAITVSDSKHLLFSDFNVYAGDGMMVFVTKSAGIKFLDCSIEPPKGRYCMNNADGFHCPSNYKGIYLERCKVFRTNDDCMNFYARLHSVCNVESNNKFVIIGGNLTSAYKPGDAIAFFNSNTGKIDALTTIESVKAVECGENKSALQIVTKDPVPDIISRIGAGRPAIVKGRDYTSSGGNIYREAMAIKAPFEHMVMNLAMKNDGFIIRNCHFGYNRATGFKCKATNGVIRNSQFHDQIVLFQAELDWREGTYPANIEITDVIFDKGVNFRASLPGKSLRKESVITYMKNLNFFNAKDASGNEISLSK